MATVRVEFEIELPDVACDEDELDEWLRFSFGARGDMSADNPLVKHEPEADCATFDWEWV